MNVSNEFALQLPPDEAYAVLLDLERVAPCIPGAQLGAERADGARDLSVAVRLGPMRFLYEGTVRIAERDLDARRAVLVGSAAEARGQGTAEARITMTVAEAAARASRVESRAELELTGRAAQMGSGVIEGVATKLIEDMAAELESRLVAGSGDSGEPAPIGGGDVSGAESARPVRVGSLLIRVLWDTVRSLFRRLKSLFRRRKGDLRRSKEE